MARFLPAVLGGSRNCWVVSAWSVLPETDDVFLVKTSELHSNLMEDIKQTALKYHITLGREGEGERGRERGRDLTGVFFY